MRVRGEKAKLNFKYRDYVDANGAILPDPQVEGLLLEATNPTKPRRQRAKTKAALAAVSGVNGAWGRPEDVQSVGGEGAYAIFVVTVVAAPAWSHSRHPLMSTWMGTMMSR